MNRWFRKDNLRRMLDRGVFDGIRQPAATESPAAQPSTTDGPAAPPGGTLPEELRDGAPPAAPQ